MYNTINNTYMFHDGFNTIGKHRIAYLTKNEEWTFNERVKGIFSINEIIKLKEKYRHMIDVDAVRLY